MASNDLHAQWISFCKAATPGVRYWLNDELFNDLCEALTALARYTSEAGYTYALTYRGGYELGGLTFYRKSIFPNPPRRAPGRQEFYAR